MLGAPFFQIEITNERRTQRNRLLEMKVQKENGEEPFFAIATLYGSELYLNLPASPEANDFVHWLSHHIGEPAEAPIVKCSANWSENMVGPMQTIIWRLEPAQIERFDLALEQISKEEIPEEKG